MGRNYPHILSAALLLMVWIATPILSLVHGLVQEHSYCTEHERLEDADKAHSRSPLLADSSKEAREALARIPQGEAPGHSGGHEECAFDDSYTRETLVIELDASMATALLALTVSGVDPPAVHTPSTALFRIAPKNSPPHTS